jgi:hypothetical protein
MKYILNTIQSFLFLTLLVSSLAFATGAPGADPNEAFVANGAGAQGPNDGCPMCKGGPYIDSPTNKAFTPGKDKQPGSSDGGLAN